MIRPLRQGLVPFGRPGPMGGEASRTPHSDWGARGAAILSLAEAGLPVPPGLLVPSDPLLGLGPEMELVEVTEVLRAGLPGLERRMGQCFGSRRQPLFLSVLVDDDRVAPRRLDLVGINHRTIEGLVRRTGRPRGAYRRWFEAIATFGQVIHALPRGLFDELLTEERTRALLPAGCAPDLSTWQRLVSRALGLIELHGGRPMPAEPLEQLRLAVRALARPEQEERPRGDGQRNSIIVQAMVFGNSSPLSGSGIVSTRDPLTGQDHLYVDYVPNGDLLALRTGGVGGAGALETWTERELLDRHREVYRILDAARPALERRFGDMVEAQFVVEDGMPWILDARPAGRTDRAALRVAIDQVSGGLISRHAALDSLAGVDLARLERTGVVVRPDHDAPPLCHALSAAPGVACGELFLDAGRALDRHRNGVMVVPALELREQAGFRGLAVAQGLIQIGGSRSSRAASLARKIGIPCVVLPGADAFIDRRQRTLRIADASLSEGTAVTLDGTTGQVHPGRLESSRHSNAEILSLIRGWIREARLGHHVLAY